MARQAWGAGHRLRLPLILTLLLVAFPTMAYNLYTVKPVINCHAMLPGEPLPPEFHPAATGAPLSVTACRGEREPASFVVEATGAPLRSVRVVVGQLRAEDGGALPQDAVDVRLAVRCALSIRWDQGPPIPWVLAHDPDMIRAIHEPPAWVKTLSPAAIQGPPDAPVSFADYQAGHSWTNALLKPLVDSASLRPVDIAEREQFWVTVHVPQDAAAGTYQAPVWIAPHGKARSKLTLVVRVPDFDLAPPRAEFSVYFPSHLQDGTMGPGFAARNTTAEADQYLAQLRNMAEHGCLNPCIYGGPRFAADGVSIDFSYLRRILDLREQAGMGPGGPLYVMDGGGIRMGTAPLTSEQYAQNVERMKLLVAWVRAQGYSDVYMMGADEATGETLTGQRPYFESWHEGGGKVWAAGYAGFEDLAGDLIDTAIVMHPGALVQDREQWGDDPTTETLREPQPYSLFPSAEMRALAPMIAGQHARGFRVFTYMDPFSGHGIPQPHRAWRGWGMWQLGLDGTMTWAYTHYGAQTLTPESLAGNGVPVGGSYFVLLGPRGVLDTLAWEAYREGYDDARYLATLEAAIARKPESAAAQEAAAWLVGMREVSVDAADLDALREALVARIEAVID